MAESYRQNVAALIVNKEKKVLMCEHAWIDDAWQLPQGGVEEGEEEDSAVLRELEEELGSRKFKIIAKMDKPLRYKYPYYLKEKYHSEGQEQHYYLLYFYGDDSEIRFDNQDKPEFKSFQWVNFDEPPKMVIYFKKLVYLRAVEYFKKDLEKFDPKTFS